MMVSSTFLLVALGYLLVSAYVLGLVVRMDDDGPARFANAVLCVILAPFLPFVHLADRVWEWLEAHAQAKTFWFYLFNRKRLIHEREELEKMHQFTLKYKSTGSLEHRLWRVAMRIHFKANKYTP